MEILNLSVYFLEEEVTANNCITLSALLVALHSYSGVYGIWLKWHKH